eukprot:GHVQ01028125.1.p1 GENE.GHVQ01028125.1~~GHVQ01028125.1.p1  ORF type:complete len:186 (+),score=15.65 GHVQ01028125.1:797-1354(+)
MLSKCRPDMPLSSVNRSIVLDGLDVCLRHGRGGRMSFKGLEVAAGWFIERGHPLVVVVPYWLLHYPFAFPDNESRYEGRFVAGHSMLTDMYIDGLVVALENHGIPKHTSVTEEDVESIVSLCGLHNAVLCSNNSGMFRRFARTNEKEYNMIHKMQLMYSFDVDHFCPCHDQGREGPLARDLLLRW